MADPRTLKIVLFLPALSIAVFANVIVLNKVDAVSKEHLGILKSTLKKLNPNADLVETNFSKVDPKRILHTGLFDFEEAEASAGWIEELNKEEHTP